MSLDAATGLVALPARRGAAVAALRGLRPLRWTKPVVFAGILFAAKLDDPFAGSRP